MVPSPPPLCSMRLGAKHRMCGPFRCPNVMAVPESPATQGPSDVSKVPATAVGVKWRRRECEASKYALERHRRCHFKARQERGLKGLRPPPPGGGPT